jgi:DNA-binding NtrC family response regulator
MIFDAISLHTSGVLSLESIRATIAEHIHTRTPANGASVQPEGSQQTANELLSFPGRFPTLKEAEDSLVDEALRRAEGNQTIAAELLGISRRALNNRLRRTDENTV